MTSCHKRAQQSRRVAETHNGVEAHMLLDEGIRKEGLSAARNNSAHKQSNQTRESGGASYKHQGYYYKRKEGYVPLRIHENVQQHKNDLHDIVPLDLALLLILLYVLPQSSRLDVVRPLFREVSRDARHTKTPTTINQKYPAAGR